MFWKHRTDFRKKVKEIFDKSKKKIGVLLIIWVIMVVINYLLGTLKANPIPLTSYEPHVSIMDDTQKVPQNLQEPIENLFSQFVEYCNNQNYVAAYNMLSDGCKEYLYPTQKDFDTYAKSIFNTKKIYNIQNYSVNDGVYIYNLRILDDVLATGLTGEEDLLYYEEKAVIENIDNNLYLSIGGYIKEEKLYTLFEDEYMKLTVDKVVVMDDREIYTMNVRNKTDNIIIIADNSYIYEIGMKMGSETRKIQEIPIGGIVLYPSDEKKTYELSFTKFYDETEETESIIFNTVYIVNKYVQDEEIMKKEKENAIDSYSFELKLH
ncbi:MAG TPA: hypothetical protein DDY53_05080 [Clostridiales bacterium]|nr:hypothetical protein [Clostridiales bacterium]